MKNNEIKKLLDKLASIPHNKWTWNGTWLTIINDSEISIIGCSDFGFSYEIKIDNIEVYHGDKFDFLSSIFCSIDSQLDKMCNNLYKQNRKVEADRSKYLITGITND